MLAARSAVAQLADTKVPPTPTDPPPIRFFTDAPPKVNAPLTFSGTFDSWWKTPTQNGATPVWKLGITGTFVAPKGIALSGGLTGRRGDPFASYVSDAIPNLGQFLGTTMPIGPGAERTKWDATFGVQAPLHRSPRLDVRARAEWLIPLGGARGLAPGDPTAGLLSSRAYRFLVVMKF